jgi:hypothetical protein
MLAGTGGSTAAAPPRRVQLEGTAAARMAWTGQYPYRSRPKTTAIESQFHAEK